MSSALIVAQSVGRNRIEILREFVKKLLGIYGDLEISSLYELHAAKESMEFEEIKNPLGNVVVAIGIKTEQRPRELTAKLSLLVATIETQFNHAKCLNYELLLCGDTIMMTPPLTLPHPQLHKRPDLLVPAAEIWGAVEHPVLSRPLSSLVVNLQKNNWGEFYARNKSLLDSSL